MSQHLVVAAPHVCPIRTSSGCKVPGGEELQHIHVSLIENPSKGSSVVV